MGAMNVHVLLDYPDLTRMISQKRKFIFKGDSTWTWSESDLVFSVTVNAIDNKLHGRTGRTRQSQCLVHVTVTVYMIAFMSL